MSSKPAGYSPVIGTAHRDEKAAGIQRLFLTVSIDRVTACALDVSFQEVVHPVRTEEAEVVEASCNPEGPDEHP